MAGIRLQTSGFRLQEGNSPIVILRNEGSAVTVGLLNQSRFFAALRMTRFG